MNKETLMFVLEIVKNEMREYEEELYYNGMSPLFPLCADASDYKKALYKSSTERYQKYIQAVLALEEELNTGELI